MRDEGRYSCGMTRNERFAHLGANLQTQRRGDETVQRRARFRRRRDHHDHRSQRGSRRHTAAGCRNHHRQSLFRAAARFRRQCRRAAPPLRYDRAGALYRRRRKRRRTLYDTLSAPPVAPIPRRFTLDEVRYSRRARLHALGRRQHDQLRHEFMGGRTGAGGQARGAGPRHQRSRGTIPAKSSWLRATRTRSAIPSTIYR